jgi:hypothetical protein
MTYRDPSEQPRSHLHGCTQQCRMEQGRHCGGYSGHSSRGGHHCLRDQQDLDQHGNWPEHDDVGAQHNRPRRRVTGPCSYGDSAIERDTISVTGRARERPLVSYCDCGRFIIVARAGARSSIPPRSLLR